MPRLFAAIAIPDAMTQALALARGGLEGARWVDPSDYHITLRFIGDVDAGLADELAERLSELDAQPFEVRAEEFGAFGGDAPHSVHLRIAADEAISALHGACEQVCRAVGLAPETRNFAPHVTIARLRKKRPDSVARWLGEHSYAGPRSFRATSFGLWTARPGGGAPYDEALSFPLTD